MTPEKTPENDYRDKLYLPLATKVNFADELRRIKDQLDYRAMALLAAQTLPNQSAAELLASADKIEAWLRKYDIQQKSTDSYVSASQDTNVFP